MTIVVTKLNRTIVTKTTVISTQFLRFNGRYSEREGDTSR